MPVVHATGIGFVGTPGLELRNFKTEASWHDEIIGTDCDISIALDCIRLHLSSDFGVVV